MNIASEIVSTIFDALHKSHASLHSDDPDLEHNLISTARCLDFVCVAHNVFGLPIREQKKCKCLNESSEEKKHTTFFHIVDVSAIQTTEVINNNLFYLFDALMWKILISVSYFVDCSDGITWSAPARCGQAESV